MSTDKPATPATEAGQTLVSMRLLPDMAERVLAIEAQAVAPWREALLRARNDLLAYGHHNEGEVVHRGAQWDRHREAGEPCRCGLDRALAQASAALGEKPQSEREARALLAGEGARP